MFQSNTSIGVMDRPVSSSPAAFNRDTETLCRSAPLSPPQNPAEKLGEGSGNAVNLPPLPPGSWKQKAEKPRSECFLNPPQNPARGGGRSQRRKQTTSTTVYWRTERGKKHARTQTHARAHTHAHMRTHAHMHTHARTHDSCWLYVCGQAAGRARGSTVMWEKRETMMRLTGNIC